MPSPVAVYVESGQRRAFACALDWPGWCRAGRDEERAVEALLASAPRYAAVAAAAGVRFPRRVEVEVVERLPGSVTTDFGAPDAQAAGDGEPLGRQAKRTLDLLDAAWAAFDRAVAAAPAELRKGPRGGGRDRDAIAAHVLAAETAYARKIGLRLAEPAYADTPAVAAHRAAVSAALRSGGWQDPPERARPWPVRYAARRIAWHVLDHAWEVEDRAS